MRRRAVGRVDWLLHNDIECDHEAENDGEEVDRERCTKMFVMTVFARYLSSSDNFAPAAGRRANKSAENPAKVIIRPANVYKKVAPLISMFCSRRETRLFWRACS
jgi:hypothetical protein